MLVDNDWLIHRTYMDYDYNVVMLLCIDGPAVAHDWDAFDIKKQRTHVWVDLVSVHRLFNLSWSPAISLLRT